jgi:hypothetical protein
MPIAIPLICFTIMSPNLMQLLNITSSRVSSKAADDNAYMFDTFWFETTLMRMTLPECAEETTTAAKMMAVETAIAMEVRDSDKLTSTLKPTTAY